MPTLFIRRILFIVGNSRKATFNAWWAANIDTEGAGDQTFTVPLSATGLAPATHWAACGAFTEPQFKKIMARLCNLSSITPPANWDGMTRNEKRDWLRGQIPAIRAAIGVSILIGENDNGGVDYQAELLARGLQTIGAINA